MRRPRRRATARRRSAARVEVLGFDDALRRARQLLGLGQAEAAGERPAPATCRSRTGAAAALSWSSYSASAPLPGVRLVPRADAAGHPSDQGDHPHGRWRHDDPPPPVLDAAALPRQRGRGRPRPRWPLPRSPSARRQLAAGAGLFRRAARLSRPAQRPALDQRRADGGVLPAGRPGDQARVAGRPALHLAAPRPARHRRGGRHGGAGADLRGLQLGRPGHAARLGHPDRHRHRLRARRAVAARRRGCRPRSRCS